MSNGQKKKAELNSPKFVTLDADEFSSVCQRVHGLLIKRVETAWRKSQKYQTQRSIDNHVEASKDAFAFVHLMELVEHMTEEIHELRSALTDVSEEELEMAVNVVGGPTKKTYLN